MDITQPLETAGEKFYLPDALPDTNATATK